MVLVLRSTYPSRTNRQATLVAASKKHRNDCSIVVLMVPCCGVPMLSWGRAISLVPLLQPPMQPPEAAQHIAIDRLHLCKARCLRGPLCAGLLGGSSELASLFRIWGSG